MDINETLLPINSFELLFAHLIGGFTLLHWHANNAAHAAFYIILYTFEARRCVNFNCLINIALLLLYDQFICVLYYVYNYNLNYTRKNVYKNDNS